jgi:hypothetical protein
MNPKEFRLLIKHIIIYLKMKFSFRGLKGVLNKTSIFHVAMAPCLQVSTAPDPQVIEDVRLWMNFSRML